MPKAAIIFAGKDSNMAHANTALCTNAAGSVFESKWLSVDTEATFQRLGMILMENRFTLTS
jgi:hypothetical protein